MNIPSAAVLGTAFVPRPRVELDPALALCLAAAALALTAFFALLRSALMHSVSARVLDRARSEEDRRRLTPLLARAEPLATSASILEITCQIVFLVLVFAGSGGEPLDAIAVAVALAVTVPLLVFAGEVLPAALRGERSDALLRTVLPAFAVLQRPLAAIIYGLEGTHRATMRLFRIPARPPSARQIVEDFRTVVEDSERPEGLREAEREIIENVVEFYDVDVAEIMTPRTELLALEVEDPVEEFIRRIAESGHTRIPVYEENLDTIIGIAYARDVLQLVATGRVQGATMSDLVRPVTFVPETKLVSELLAEFRRTRQKMAVVIDEYGGTAGVVTMADILAELVGEIPGEHEAAAPAPVVKFPDGSFEVQGATHVSDVNAEIGLDLPEEEDFETLAGFVLSELGRFPKEGESFQTAGAEFTVAAASDRRVLRVRVRPLAP
ncbi:MAG: hemolysin family protein [Planctomycetota bacterium]